MKIFLQFMLVQLSILHVASGQEELTRVMSFNIRYDAASDGENRWEFRRDRFTVLMTP